MDQFSINRTESYVEGFRKYWKTIWITIRHPRELFAMIKKDDFNSIYKPLPVYVFTVFLFFIVTQFLPYTTTYAPYYSPWGRAEKINIAESMDPGFFLFIIVNLVVGLILIFLSAALFGRRHLKILFKVFLYAGATVIFLKMIFVAVFPIIGLLVYPNARISGIFIHPNLLWGFDFAFYYLLIMYVWIFPKTDPDKDNFLFIQIYETSNTKISGNPSKAVYAAALFLLLCIMNFSIDQLNAFAYKHINPPKDKAEVDLTDMNEASREALFLTASNLSGDSVIIQGKAMIKLEKSGYIPSKSPRMLYFEMEETRERRFVFVYPYLDMEYQVKPSENGTILFEPGKIYPVTLKSSITFEQFNKFLQRFNQKEAKISFKLYVGDAENSNQAYCRKIVVNTDSLQQINNLATSR